MPCSSSSTSRRPGSRRRATRSASSARCACERSSSLDSFQSLVDPRVALPEPIARLTGLREEELRGAPGIGHVLERFLAFAGDDLLVAHNARFDQRFLEQQLLVRHGRRLSEPPLCTAALARRLLEGRRRRVGLASLANFFGVGTAALPPRAARRGGDGRDPRPPDRPRTGDRRAAALRPARPRGAAETTRLRQALARQRRADAARASTSSATATTRCCTSGGPATCAPGCARTSAPTASGLRSRPPCTRSTASSGASSAPSSKRPSRRCA